MTAIAGVVILRQSPMRQNVESYCFSPASAAGVFSDTEAGILADVSDLTEEKLRIRRTTAVTVFSIPGFPNMQHPIEDSPNRPGNPRTSASFGLPLLGTS